MSEPDLRQQLLDARASLERQIEILRAGPASLGKGGGFIDNRGLIAELSATLAEIEDSLHALP